MYGMQKFGIPYKLDEKRVIYTPATLHVNFCVTKHKGLDERGLWFVNYNNNSNSNSNSNNNSYSYNS